MEKVRRRSRRILIGVGIFFFAYTVFGFLIVPYALRSILAKKLTTALSREVTIEKISFNPYNLKLTVRGFKVKDKTGDKTFIAFDELFLNVQSVSILKRGLVVKEVRLTRPYAAITRNNDMSYNFSDLILSDDAGKKPEPKSDKKDSFRFSINNIQIIKGSIDINDRPKKTTHKARDITLNIPLISNLPYDVDIFVKPSFSVVFNDTAFAFKGTTKPFKDSLETLMGLKLTALDLPYYMAYSPFPLDFRLASGKASLDMTLSYIQSRNKGQKLTLSGNVKLKNIEVDDLAGKSIVRLPLLRVDIADAGLFTQKIHLARIFIKNPTVNAVRNRQGVMNLTKLVPAMATPTPSPEKQVVESPFTLDIDTIKLVGGVIRFTDYTPPTPFRRSIAPLNVEIKGFSTSKGKKARLRLSFEDKAGESINVKGGFSINPVSADMRLDVKKINLVPFQPYLESTLNLAVKRAYVGVSGQLKAALQQDGALQASFKGSAGLSGLRAIDRLKADDFIKLKTLTLKGMDIGYGPGQLRLDVKTVDIADFYVRVIVGTDGTINLSEILAGNEAEGKAVPAPPAEANAGVTTQEGAPEIRINKVRLARGSLNFTDRLIKPRYSTDVVKIGGTITGLSSDASKYADVNISAMIDKYAPFTVTGKVNPLSKDLFLDLKVDLKNFELSGVSPYSGKYIGNTIARGKLFLDLKYRIEKRKLESQNNVLIDRIALGEKVESPDATGLPVGFALSLLKDREGKINLKLPVSGSLDNPEFRVGGIIFKMVLNLFVKAATSPFALLGAILGDVEELSYVEFDTGRAALAEGKTKSLDALITALYERPGLKLEIEGFVDSDKDSSALRDARFVRKIKAQKFKSLVKGQPDITVDEIVIKDDEYGKYLWRAYKKEKFKKPRNVIGLTKKITVPEMEKLMLSHTKITKDDLRELARARSQAVRDYITNSGKVEEERLFIVRPDSVLKKAEKGLGNSRVEFKLR